MYQFFHILFFFIHVCDVIVIILFCFFFRYIDDTEYALPEYDVQSSFQFKILDRTFDLFFYEKEGLAISNFLCK